MHETATLAQNAAKLKAEDVALERYVVRNGQMDKSVDHFYELLEGSQKAFEKDPAFGNRQLRDTIQGNIDTVLVRMSQRGYFAEQRKETDLSGYDTQPPFNVGFSVKCTVVEPRVLKFEGTWNVLPVGTRIRVVLVGIGPALSGATATLGGGAAVTVVAGILAAGSVPVPRSEALPLVATVASPVIVLAACVPVWFAR